MLLARSSVANRKIHGSEGCGLMTGGAFGIAPRPLDYGMPFLGGAVPQEEVDEVLTGHPEFRREPLEIVDGRGVLPNCDGALQLFDVRVPA